MVNAKFSGVVGEKGCVCDGCHEIGSVLKISCPRTSYLSRFSTILTTQFQEYWLCEKCKGKLLNVLMGISDEGGEPK